eukprot:TRINITY_DN419_c0_g1_i1.p1 TRINITY_DN419_c0_g1~~TRINITY_DN419_c0_g1_i1.p1  ORF type:complete len:610 (-),score=122.00 TRINITY_DN419_c0_g1_i1:21-1850(-)
MSIYETFHPINIQQKFSNKTNNREDSQDNIKFSNTQENETEYNELEFSDLNLIINDEYKEDNNNIIIQQNTSIFISLNTKSTSKNNISPHEHRTTSKTQGISLDNNNTPDNFINNTFYISTETITTIVSDPSSNNQQISSIKQHKKAKKDLENSYNSLSIDEDEDVDMNALNGSSRSNLALDLLASCTDENRNGSYDMELHIDKMSKNDDDDSDILYKKRKSQKILKPISYVLPNSDKVKKLPLFVLPDKVNAALSKNFKTSLTLFCPIHETKYDEFLQKVSLKEFKLMAKEGPKIPKTWPDKLKAFPSATTYFAYAKNRYRDVLANEESRVRLKGVEQDYINANFIKPVDVFGRKVRNAKKFIACQAPIPSTLNDFWLMTWQQKSCVIVMLTKFTEKSVKKANSYWPKKKSETISYGDFNVTNKGSVLLDNLTITFLELNSNGNNNRIIYHLHYTEWPDFGVPSSTLILRSLITFTDLYSYSGSTRNLCGPIICHCSAGIGRTGTFIATHLSLSVWKAEEEKPNVYEIVKKLRELRSGMVQSDSQYLFIYKVFNDYIYLSNHPKKSHRYSSVNSLSLISDEIKTDKRRKKAFLKKSNSLTNINSLLHK